MRRKPPLATLSMYDWPEVRSATDRLWQLIRDNLQKLGIDAPGSLERRGEVERLWRSADLIVGQTCGLPYRMHLFDKVALVGTPAYALNDCQPGDYCSVVIVGKHVVANVIEDLRGKRVAFNAVESQSGYSALRRFVAQHARNGSFFAEAVRSGAHRESIRLVATAKADVAAIDAVSWELACRYEPAARYCLVFARTTPTPGLPVITARSQDVDAVANAFADAISSLDDADRNVLLLCGFRTRRPADYDVVSDMIREAEAVGYPSLR